MKTEIDRWCIYFILASLSTFWIPNNWLETEITPELLLLVLLTILLCSYLLAVAVNAWFLHQQTQDRTTILQQNPTKVALESANPTLNFAVVNWNFHKILVFAILCGVWWGFYTAYHAHSENIEQRLQHDFGLHLNTLQQPISFRVQFIGLPKDEGWRWQADALLLPAEPQSRWGKLARIGRPRPKIRLYEYTMLSDADENRVQLGTAVIPKPGEIWKITARTRPISGRLNQGGFNFQAYLLRRSVYFTGTIEHAHRLGDEVRLPRWRIYNYLQQQRATVPFSLSDTDEGAGTNAHADTEGLLHSPRLYTDILLALMVGDRQWLTEERWRLLQETGLAHVMAISGLHLTLVFASAWWFSRFLLGGVLIALQRLLPGAAGKALRQYTIDSCALLFALSVALFYAWLAGFAVSTVRALLLVGLFTISRLFCWRVPVLRILLRCIALVLIVDPLAWLDAGFWLSVCAVSIIFLWQWRGPVQRNSWQPEPGIANYLWQLFALEIMLTLALAPLSIALFNGFPWIAPFTNLVFLPLFSVLVMPLVLLAAAAILLVPDNEPLLAGLGLLLDYLLHNIFYGLAMSTSLPYHWWPSIDLRFGWLFIGVLILYFWPARWRYRIASALVALPILNMLLKPTPAQEFAVHVLDVGQGTAVVVQRERHALLFDAGPGFRFGSDIGTTTLLPFLQHHQLIPEWLVISHNHQDHTGGIAALMEQWPQLQLMRSRFFVAAGETWGWLPQPFPESLFGNNDHKNNNDADDISWPCAWGQQWLWHGVRVRALAPLPGPSFGPNNDSCVLQLEYAGHRVLLTGDVQQQTELRMVGRYGAALRSDVLILPHHGSRTSSQVDFLVQVKPQIGIVSRGYRNSFQMPHKEVLQRFEMAQVPLYDTGIDGQVSVNFSETGIQVRTFRKHIKPRWYSRLLSEAKE